MKKSKKNKVNYNFPKETCELIAERDGNECLFCKLGTIWTSADQKCF